MPLIVGGAVFGVLAAALAFFTYRAMDRFSTSQEALEQQTNKLRRLRNREPFPSQENAAVLESQRQHFGDYLSALRGEMGKAQAEIGDVSRDRWNREFGQTLRSIVMAAHAKGVNLSPAVTGGLFGFDRYREVIPLDSELGRLFPQLQGVSRLCGILFDAGITELVGVEREQFELIPATVPVDEEENSRRGRRGRRQADEEEVAKGPSRDPFKDKDGLFTREHYALVFRAKDEAVWNVLSAFAKEPEPFIVVTKVDVSNAARPQVPPPRGPEALPGAPALAPARMPTATDGFRAAGVAAPAPEKDAEAPLPRELRVVAGNDLSLVRIELDIYRFAAEDAPATEEEPA